VHFGLIVNSLPHPDLVLTRLYRDAVDIMALAEPAAGAGGRAPRGAPGKHPKAPTLADAQARLKAGPLIYAEHFPASEELIRRLSGEGLMPNRVLVCGDLEQVKSLALAGIGVALLPRRVAAYGQAGRLCASTPPSPFSPDIIYRFTAATRTERRPRCT
jgi:DNA-binding transcriptional LysR family regulator